MKRISILIDEEQYDALGKLATAKGASRAELIRRSIDSLLNAHLEERITKLERLAKLERLFEKLEKLEK